MIAVEASFTIMCSSEVNNSGGSLDNQTWQTARKSAPLAKVQLCEYENQTLEAFVAASRSYVKYDCAVAHQNVSLLATAHDCEAAFNIDPSNNDVIRRKALESASCVNKFSQIANIEPTTYWHKRLNNLQMRSEETASTALYRE